MKRLLLFTLCALPISLFAQISITSADIGDQGDSMIIAETSPTTAISVGGTGSQTWSFNFGVDGSNTLVFEDPSNAASGVLFPNADIVIERQTDTFYLKKSATLMEIDGIAGTLSAFSGVPVNLAINIPDDITQLEFPSTYQSAFTDQATIDTIINCADINAQAYCTQARIKRRYLVDSEIDAYGPLETSGGTYGATIRQYYKERTVDSIWANLPIIGGPLNFVSEIDSTQHIYRWYATGEKWPVLFVSADGQGGDILYAEYQIDNLLGEVVSSSNPSCNGDCDGTATLTGLGADPPYSYTWPASANNQTGETASGLCAGTYMVTIQDNDTDTYEVEVILDNPPAINITGSVQGVNFENDGAIDITVSGGAGGFSYEWSGPEGFTATTPDISGLSEGDYTVTATDANDCDSSRTFSVMLTGIEETGGANVQMYPNPAKHQLTVESATNFEHIVVRDLLGNTLINRPLTGVKAEFDLSGFANGIYMVEIQTQKGMHLQKLTVSH